MSKNNLSNFFSSPKKDEPKEQNNIEKKQKPQLAEGFKKKEEEDEVQAQVKITKTHLSLIKEQYPELTLPQQKVLNYFYIVKSPFPMTAWGISRFLPYSEEEITKILQFFTQNPKYKIIQVPFNSYDGYELIKEKKK